MSRELGAELGFVFLSGMNPTSAVRVKEREKRERDRESTTLPLRRVDTGNPGSL